jgi:plasmid stabilization system protein ParE
MSHVVRFQTRADAWIEREIDYLAERRPQAAIDFIAAIERARRQLSEHPMSGPPGTVPDTRRLAVGAYILSYRVRRGVVEIFAVRHGRQRDARVPLP